LRRAGPGSVVVADEGHFIEADREEVKPAGRRAPAQASRHRVGVAALDIRVMLSARGAADLELALTAVPAGDDAVHEDARVAQQVSGLGRWPEHGQPQVAVHYERLYRADPGRAVSPDRRHEHDTGREQALPPEPGQARLGAFHLRPAHAPSDPCQPK
jgi:hypothetical protein